MARIISVELATAAKICLLLLIFAWAVELSAQTGEPHKNLPPADMRSADWLRATGHPQRSFVSKIEAGPVTAVTRVGKLIVAELAAGSFLPSNLLDLENSSLNFVPDGNGRYQVSSGPLTWDNDFGSLVDAADGGYPSTQVSLTGFQFPFAAQLWSEIFVNAHGAISFGANQDAFYSPTADRFLLFSRFASDMQGDTPIIAPLFRKLGGHFGFRNDSDDANSIFVKQSPDSVLVTWEIGAPYRDLQNFTQDAALNRFQLRLSPDGSIRFSYLDLAVEDGIVGVFAPPDTNCAAPTPLRTGSDPVDGGLPAHIDLAKVDIYTVGDCALEFVLTMRGNLPAAGDPSLASLFYRVHVDFDEPLMTSVDFSDADLIVGVDVDASLQYRGLGPVADFEITGNQVRVRVALAAFLGATDIALFFDTVDFDAPGLPFDQSSVFTLTLPVQASTATDLSQRNGTEAATPSVFEAFHYIVPPPNEQIACAVIAALGDQFDMLANFTDFRIDTQEGGATSSGPIGDTVTGLANPDISRDPADYCSAGELEVVQDYVAIEVPIAARVGTHFDTPWIDHGGQVALLSHELGHRWLAYGNTAPATLIDGPHWQFGLHLEAPGMVSGPFDHSPMGGNYWIDNANGNFTIAAKGFFYPAKAYAWLDLYLMGLVEPAQVPDFFVVQNPIFLINDGMNRPVYTGVRIDVSVDDFIAQNGLRLPTSAQSQSTFKIGIIGIVLPAAPPSTLLIDRMSGIAQAFEVYWSAATDGRSEMPACGADPMRIFGGGFEDSETICR